MNEWEGEPNSTDEMLTELYELGVEHGRKLAAKEAELEQLKKEVEELTK